MDYGESCLASHEISSDAQEAVMIGLQNGINMGNHKRSKFRTLRLYCSSFLLLHQCSHIKSTVLRMSSCRQVPRHNRHNYTNLCQSCTVHVNDFKQLTTLWWCTSTLPQFHENSLKEIPSSTTKFQYRTYYNISEINVHKWEITASVCLLHNVHWLQS